MLLLLRLLLLLLMLLELCNFIISCFIRLWLNFSFYFLEFCITLFPFYYLWWMNLYQIVFWGVLLCHSFSFPKCCRLLCLLFYLLNRSLLDVMLDLSFMLLFYFFNTFFILVVYLELLLFIDLNIISLIIFSLHEFSDEFWDFRSQRIFYHILSIHMASHQCVFLNGF
jgi:hypothetical protein